MVEESSSIKDILSGLTALIGVSGFGFGMYQYYKAQLWKKSEFAASQLQQLSDNPDLALCCVFLDWEARRIPIPERYQVFVKEDEKSFVHNWDNVKRGLALENDEANFDWPYVLYRDVFDQFFVYLDRINHYISIGLFKVEDVYSLKYWLDEIESSRYLPKGEKDIFIKFIESYGYHGVINLMDTFKLEEQKIKAGMRPRRA